ncbi:MAG: adenylate/guanylate cyclase domain-containing protein [Gammaproteobacteria bacterium]|nr:adenylate/guanylate cyclase domain-containing protein [Gammaproteobacteria bacterium]
MARRRSSRGDQRSTPENGKSRTREPERRQLTVMFCDLVESTALSQQIDPEDLRDVIRLFQSTCAGIIERYEGYVSRYMGDGILVLFGYPSAHEDDAERAVHAALEITKAVSALKAPYDVRVSLAVRTGIATGLVVAGDVIGEGSSEEEAIVGGTPNLAARLQSLADPNTVIISEETRRLLLDAFDYRSLGERALKGFDAPVVAWRVIGPSAVETRFEAAHNVALTPWVDRNDEIEVMRQQWEHAKSRQGRALLVSGEAGIGKSRLTRALREQLATEPHTSLQFQCSPYYRYTALYPFSRHLERAARFERDDSHALKQEKLRAILDEESLPILAHLISVPTDKDDEIAQLSPQRRKELIFKAVLSNIVGRARQLPLLATVEDVHWMDPTSLELMTFIIDHISDASALFVLTFRPEFSPEWTDKPNVSMLKLNGLHRQHGERLAESIFGNRPLPKEIIYQLVDKTDGVPLFIEELAKSLLESGAVGKNGSIRRNGLPEISEGIPVTLMDSLMARIDQLGEAKSIAQIGAVVGQEFTHSLISMISPLPEEELQSQLNRLVSSGLAVRRFTSSDTRYAFKHALVRDAAYNSLLRRRREALHVQIAESLESRIPETATNQPELLAHHFTEARMQERAIDYWLKAGRRASERSANAEAVVHLNRGIEALRVTPESQSRWKRELEFLTLLGPALMSTRGPGTAEVARVYERALELCDRLPESEDQFNVYWGWWRVSMNHEIGRERADRLLDLGRKLDNPDLLLQAHHCQWATLFHLGRHAECCRHVESGLEIYDPSRHRFQASLYGGHDAKVCGLGEKALSMWLQGYPVSAFKPLSAALEWADALSHVGSMAHAKDYELILNLYCGNRERVAELADDMIAFSEHQGLPDYAARARFFHGWAIAQQDPGANGLEEMTKAVDSLVEIGTKEDFPMFIDLMAKVKGRRGEIEEGLRLIERAFEESENAGLRFWLAELHRCRAELKHKAGAAADEIEADLTKALEIALDQGAAAFELRTAISYSQFKQLQKRIQEGRKVLASALDKFDEGHDTRDLVEAERLLNSLK